MESVKRPQRDLNVMNTPAINSYGQVDNIIIIANISNTDYALIENTKFCGLKTLYTLFLVWHDNNNNVNLFIYYVCAMNKHMLYYCIQFYLYHIIKLDGSFRGLYINNSKFLMQWGY